MSQLAERFVCPECQARYRWRQGDVGRQIRCACGTHFRVPAAPGQAARLVPTPGPPARHVSPPVPVPDPPPLAPDIDEPPPMLSPSPPRPPRRAGMPRDAIRVDEAVLSELPRPAPDPVTDADDRGAYEVSADEAPPAPLPKRVVSFGAGGMCPSCQAPLERSALVCVACGYDLRTGRRLADEPVPAPAAPMHVPALPPRIDSGAIVEQTDQSWLWAGKGWELILTPILIAVGITLMFVQAMRYGAESRTLLEALPGVATELVASMGLMLAAIFVAALVVEDAFVGDAWWKTILKVGAIGLIPGPLGAIVGASIGDINGDIASVFTTLILYAGLFWLLFRWNVLYMAACVLIIWVIRTGVAYTLFKLQGMRSNSWV